MKENLHKFDMFKFTPKLNYKEGKGYYTYIGLCLSIGFYLLISWISLDVIKDWILKRRGTITYFQESSFNNGNPLSLKQIPFYFSLKVLLKSGRVIKGELALELITPFTRVTDRNGSVIDTNLTFQSCNSETKNQYSSDVRIALEKQLNKSIISDLLCLSGLSEDYFIYPSGRKDGFSSANFQIYFLPKFDNNTQSITFVEINFFHFNLPIVLSEDKTNSIKLEEHGLFRQFNYLWDINKKTTQVTSINYRINKLVTYEGFIFLTEKSTNYFSGIITRDFIPGNLIYYFIFEIDMDLVTEITTIKQWNITDAISYLGGIFKFMSYFRVIVSIYYKKMVRVELVNELIRFENELDRNSKVSVIESIGKENLENIINSENEEETDKSPTKTKEKLLSKKVRPEEKTFTQEDSNMSSMVLNRVNISDLKLRSEVEKFSLSIILPFQCCKTCKEKKKAYKKQESKVMKLLDVSTMIKNLLIIERKCSQIT